MDSALGMMESAGLDGEAAAGMYQQEGQQQEEPEDQSSRGPDADGWETVARKPRRGR